MLKLTPHFVEKPWGGSFISDHYRLDRPLLGEAWILSTLSEGESTVDGSPLSVKLGSPLSFLVKIIDAQEPLSVQVHPNDEWAQKLENSKGKTECWLILDTKPGAGIYLGVNPGVDEAQMRTAVAADDVTKLMKFYPVKKGDFISVPAGTIHAIGPGVTLLEVQQASGITYRIWDWGRKGRELHLEKSMQVSNFKATHGILFNLFESSQARLLLKHQDFAAYFNQFEGEGWFIDLETFEAYSGQTPKKKPFIFVK